MVVANGYSCRDEEVSSDEVIISRRHHVRTCLWLTIETKWLPFCGRHFQTHFLVLRLLQWFFPRHPIDDRSALVQIMAWNRSGDSQYLNQWWPRLLLMHLYVSAGLDELKSRHVVCFVSNNLLLSRWPFHAIPVTAFNPGLNRSE